MTLDATPTAPREPPRKMGALGHDLRAPALLARLCPAADLNTFGRFALQEARDGLVAVLVHEVLAFPADLNAEREAGPRELAEGPVAFVHADPEEGEDVRVGRRGRGGQTGHT